MIHVTLIAVGKLKESYLRDGCAEYCKRLTAYCKLNLIEVAEEKCGDHPSEAQIQQVLQKEGERMAAKIPDNAFVTAMCIEGKLLSSPALARQMEAAPLAGKNNLVFLIGGSFGLHDKLKQQAHLRLSMSPMTFPHQLARLLVLEQIYRACNIIAGSKYHK